MPSVLSFDPADFSFSYNQDAATEQGYVPQGTTVGVRGLLNAGFDRNAFPTATLTFTAPGDTGKVDFGTAILREDFIAQPWQHNPAAPEELKLTVTVAVDGLPSPLTFEAVPFVESAPAAGLGAPERPLQAPKDNVGATEDTDPARIDFKADFAPRTFEVGGYQFTADISDIVFTNPDSRPAPDAPVETETVSLLLTLDSAPLTLSVADATAAEGDANPGGVLNFVVSLSAPAPVPVTVQVAVRPGPDTSTTATAGSGAGADYIPISDQTITFAPGETSKPIAITLLGDTAVEPDETLTFLLSSPSAPATLAKASATGTITNDDQPPTPPPTLSVADAAAAEGNANPGGVLSFAVTLSKAASTPVSVQFTTSDGTATAAVDYTPASGTVTFAPGEVSKSIPVAILGDTVNEPDETVTLTLSGATAPITFAKATATGTIGNDDFVASPPVVVPPVVPPTAPTNFVVGTDGNDVLRGTPQNDSISALGGGDTVVPLAGDDFVEGGSGVDTALYSGVKRSYAFVGATNGQITVGGPEGNDTLNNVERVAFIDGRYETDATGTAGKMYRIYDSTLDRAPDAAGLRFWHDAASDGVALQAIIAGFVNSPEFAAKYGDTDSAAFVRLLYRNVLGRDADAGGLASWTAALDGGASRSDVVLRFSELQENIQRSAPDIAKGLWVGSPEAAVVVRTYDSTLDRRPDEAGLKSWTDALNSGLTVNQLVDGFTGSAEFQAKYGALGNAAFVELLYQNVLDRPADPAGLQSWTAALDGGARRSDAVLGFSESPEHVAKLAPFIDDGVWVA